jgi:hypothetical protein
MRNTVVVLLIFTLISCNQKKLPEPSFDLIDLPIYNGWTDVYSLKIYNDGQINILNNNLHKRDKYFRIYIVKKELDSISNLTNLILKQDIDSLYEAHCQDCGS